MVGTKAQEEAKKGKRRVAEEKEAVRARGERAEVRRAIGRVQRAHGVVREIVRKGGLEYGRE